MESWKERTRILTIVILGFETREEFYFLDIFLCVPYQAYFTFILRGKDFRNEIQVTQDQLLTHKVQHLTQTLLGGSVVSIRSPKSLNSILDLILKTNPKCSFPYLPKPRESLRQKGMYGWRSAGQAWV